MGQSSGEVIALAIVFPLLALFVVSLRVWARRVKKQLLAWDDYLIFIAMASNNLIEIEVHNSDSA